MKTRLVLGIVTVAFALLTGCGTAHMARPLGKGNTAINASFGGPFAEVGGATIPVPLPTVGIKHGVSDRNDLFVEWQVMPAVMGSAAFDVGGSWYFLDQHKARPGLSTALILHTAFNDQDLWFAADVPLIVSWQLHPRHLLYLGFHVVLVPVQAEAMESQPFHFAPLLGGEVRLGKNKRFGLGLEIKWADPWVDTTTKIVNYAGSRGGLCLSGGFNFYLGGAKKKGQPAGEMMVRRADR